jgi:hypothetical protein
VLIPLAVFGSPKDEIDGYEAVDAPQPDWWNWRGVFQGDGRATPAAVQPIKAKPK